jgi:hypothetical protein
VDALALRLLVKRLGQRKDIGLGRIIDRAVRPGLEGRGRGDVEQEAAAPRDHAGQDEAAQRGEGGDVERDHAEEAKGKGVHVTALCPGPTATEFFDVAGSAGGQLARLATDPVAVVRAGLDGLAGNRAIVVPGFRNKLTSQATRFLPRATVRRIVARLKA